MDHEQYTTNPIENLWVEQANFIEQISNIFYQMLEETIIEIWNSVDSKFTQKSHEFTAMERRRETYYQRWSNKISKC